MILKVTGKVIPQDPEGFLLNPEDWSKAIAMTFGEAEGILLSQKHFEKFDSMCAVC